MQLNDSLHFIRGIIAYLDDDCPSDEVIDLETAIALRRFNTVYFDMRT